MFADGYNVSCRNMNNTCRKFLLILADTMLRINTQISHWMVRCHSASPLAMPLMYCSTALVQRHPQTARKIVSCFGPSVTVLLLLGASHCAVVESDAVVLTTFDLEQQQPTFQVTSILTEIWEGMENSCFQLAICT